MFQSLFSQTTFATSEEISKVDLWMLQFQSLFSQTTFATHGLLLIADQCVWVSILVFVDEFCNKDNEYRCVSGVLFVSILVLVDDFCNVVKEMGMGIKEIVSILVFVDGFCNTVEKNVQKRQHKYVSILVFVDGFCNWMNKRKKQMEMFYCFNPCFRRRLLQRRCLCLYLLQKKMFQSLLSQTTFATAQNFAPFHF